MVIGAGQLSSRAIAQSGLPWSPEVAPLFEHYLAEDWDTVAALGKQMLAANPAESVRHDILALRALAQLRSDDRSQRNEGRSALLDIDQRSPGLLDRPECLLAYGIAQRELHETSSALRLLQDAVNGFAGQGRRARQAAAIVELARCWSVHGEWEFSPPGMDVPVVESRDARLRIRLERIEGLREQAEQLAGGPETVQSLDLIRADLLTRHERDEEAVAILESTARAQPVTKPVARAAIELGHRYESQQRWAEALALYDSAATVTSRLVSESAARAAAEIREPQLELIVPSAVAPDTPLRLDVSSRNIRSLEVELRKLDLGTWLTERQGRFVESLLPVAGSLVHAWKSSDTPAERFMPRSQAVITGNLAMGSYVAVVRGVSETGAEITRKRLVLASAARAAVITGPDQAVAWAPEVADPQARFWMHGSFVPQRLSFAQGVARFELPPERKLLRDSRWVCLFSSSAGLAICTGELEKTYGPTATTPAVAAVASPAEPRAGGELRVFGLVLPPTGDIGQLAGRMVTVQLRDVSDAQRQAVTARLGPDGAFFSSLRIDPDLAGEALRVVVLFDERVLQSAYKTLRVSVPADDVPPHRVEIVSPRWFPSDAELIECTVTAEYPWGVPVSGGGFDFGARPVRLPVNAPRGPAVPGRRFHRDGSLRSDGQWDLVVPIADFELPPGPAACLLRAQVRGLDGRLEEVLAPVLVSDHAAHVWMDWLGRPRAGHGVPVMLNWFDPLGLATRSRPRLEIRRDGDAAVPLDLVATPFGFRSDQWVPEHPGSSDLVATLPLANGDLIEHRDEIEVEPDDSSDASPLELRGELKLDTEGVFVEAELRGRRPGPSLVLLEAGNPIAVAEVAAGASPERVRLAAGVRLPERARVQVLRFQRDHLQVAASTAVSIGSGWLNPTIELAPLERAPGQEIPVRIGWTQPATGYGTSMLARLIAADEVGAVPWMAQRRSDPEHPQGGRIRFSSHIANEVAPELGDEAGWLSPDTIAALFEGQTLWVDYRRISGNHVSLNVPLPDTPGRFELLVELRTEQGLRATQRAVLDTRESVVLRIETPPTLQVGDRTVGSLTIANNSKHAVAAVLNLTPGPELRIERIERLDGGGTIETNLAEAGSRVTVPASEQLRLRVHFEAVRAGTGRLTCSLDANAGLRAVSAAYRVDSPAASPGVVQATLQRRLFRVQLPTGVAADDLDPDAHPFKPVQPADLRDLERIELSPGQRLRLGELLLVQDELRPSNPLSGLRWAQRAPSNCFTYNVPDESLRRIGRRMEHQRDASVYRTGQLNSGLNVHEFLLVAVRPGACVLPPPQLTDQGVPVWISGVFDQRVIVDSVTR
jgi:hypothetical protein